MPEENDRAGWKEVRWKTDTVREWWTRKSGRLERVNSQPTIVWEIISNFPIALKRKGSVMLGGFEGGGWQLSDEKA